MALKHLMNPNSDPEEQATTPENDLCALQMEETRGFSRTIK